MKAPKSSAFAQVFWLLWACLLAVTLASSARAAVLYQTKDEGFRLELRGYVKNFLWVQTGAERFLPSQAPKQLKDLKTLLELSGQTSSQDLQKAWDDFRRELGTSGTNLMRIRSHLKLKLGESVTLQMAYELRPMATAGSEQLLRAIPVLGPGLGGGLSPSAGAGLVTFTNFDDRFVDFPRNIFKVHSFRLDHEIDRLFLSWSHDVVDITIGRQSMLFGVGQIFRPTDVLAPFSPQEIDRQERRGVDGIKLLFPIGDLSELMIVGVVQRLRPEAQRSPDQAGYFDDFSPGGAARFKFSLKGFDIFVMGGYIQRDLVAGLGFRGSLFGAGVWAEAIYRYRLHQSDDEPHPDGLFSVAAGLSYNLGARLPSLKLVLSFEYFHNGAGSTRPERYLELTGGYRFQRGEVFTMGADYLALSARWELHPLLSVAAFAMLNLHDQSLLVAPSLEFSIKQDVSIFASAFLGFGAPPEASFKTDDKGRESLDLALKSEFGAAGLMFVLGARIYF